MDRGLVFASIRLAFFRVKFLDRHIQRFQVPANGISARPFRIKA